MGLTTAACADPATTDFGFETAAGSTSGADPDTPNDTTGSTSSGAASVSSGGEAEASGSPEGSTTGGGGQEEGDGSTVDGGASSTSGGDAVETPRTCSDVAAAGAVVDGEYTLYVDGDVAFPWTAFCVGLGSTPQAYLTLPAGAAENYAQYTAGGASPGTNVRTSFERVAIDALTLDVDIDDLTFASSTGSLLHSMEAVTAMPYGTAMSCDGTSSGVGRINLQGTPFVVGADFCVSGVGQSGEADVQNEGAVVSLTGGGSCGWSAPNPDCPFNPSTGMTGAQLPLLYAP